VQAKRMPYDSEHHALAFQPARHDNPIDSRRTLQGRTQTHSIIPRGWGPGVRRVQTSRYGHGSSLVVWGPGARKGLFSQLRGQGPVALRLREGLVSGRGFSVEDSIQHAPH
jgi:hypothetical protein